MKIQLFLFLLIVLVLYSCEKEKPINITGTWEITFVITTDIIESPTYTGEMTLFHDDDGKVTGSIEIHDELNFFAFAEILPGGFVNSRNEISFESYVWLVNDSVSTMTLTYSGTVNAPSKTGYNYYHMIGIFNSGETKIGDWSAIKQ